MVSKEMTEDLDWIQKKINNELWRGILSVEYCSIEDQKIIRDKRKELNQDNRKWAWVLLGKTRFLCWVDNITMVAYKDENREPTYMKMKHAKFIRWATLWDM